MEFDTCPLFSLVTNLLKDIKKNDIEKEMIGSYIRLDNTCMSVKHLRRILYIRIHFVV